MKFKRIFIIVLDSLGIGELPDAAYYGDSGANTLASICKKMPEIALPNLLKLGLGNITPIQNLVPCSLPQASYTKMKEASVGKDTMTGHWEFMGLKITTPFKTFPNGFDEFLLTELEKRSGRPIIGNIPASGTEIIEKYGEEHLKTGALIVYTSADSVLQIAAHEEIVPLEELYKICEIARELTLQPDYMVGRIIARPFTGEIGSFKRTSNRHDYALKPFGKTTLNELKDNGFEVISIGKINDIYNGEGITQYFSSKSNMDGMDKLILSANLDFTGLSFLNLVDFDALYGHRRDPFGYGRALEEFDARLIEFLDKLNDDDLVMITADHGNDPTMPGTDHTREYVPLLVYSKKIKAGVKLPVRETFADVGATIAQNFGVSLPVHGTSFLDELLASK